MKTTRGMSMLAAMAALTFAAGQAGAQSAAPKHETAAQLKAQAKVTEKAARATALAQVPGGTIGKHELERENGKVVYSYDIATKGKTGIDEVQIDAVTGAVLSKQHETPAMDKADAKAGATQHAVAHKAHKKAVKKA